MINEIRIILRPKQWLLGVCTFLVLLLATVYLFVPVLLDKNNPNPILGPILFLLFFGGLFYLMVLCTDKVTVMDKKIEVETLFIFKRDYLIEDIDRIVMVSLASNGDKGIDIYVKGKKVWITSNISVRWNNFDELILFFEEKNIPMEHNCNIK